LFLVVTLPPFQTLVDAHWRDVGPLAVALAGPGDGQDVAQQAWAQALSAYPSLTDAATCAAGC
jgi:DNA-directed RNA polymerase specialized sigma24 family protein